MAYKRGCSISASPIFMLSHNRELGTSNARGRASKKMVEFEQVVIEVQLAL
jgi:hypothetical protein